LERWLRKEKKMLKKSLIAIALLAIVLPAFAVDPTVLDTKFHKPWPGKIVKTYNWQNVQTINVVMDVGYWIEIKYTGDLKIAQDATLGDPFFSYSGCINNVEVKSNFAATIKGSVATSTGAHALGIDDGDNKVKWGATIRDSSGAGGDSYDVVGGSASVNICVTAKSLHIDKLPQADNYLIGILTISVIPTEFKDGTTETF
jgi:hypothetical protein